MPRKKHKLSKTRKKSAAVKPVEENHERRITQPTYLQAMLDFDFKERDVWWGITVAAAGLLPVVLMQLLSSNAATDEGSRFLVSSLFLAIVCWPIGADAIFREVRVHLQNRDMANWPTAAGEITTVGVVEQDNSSTEGVSYVYLPLLGYKYRYGGKLLFGDRVDAEPLRALRSREDAEAILAVYKPGMKVKVFVNRENPKRAVLRPEHDWSVALATAAIMFVIPFVFTLFIRSSFA